MAYTACLIGATGLVGKQVLSLLLADDDCKKILCFSRKNITQDPKLETILGDDLIPLFERDYDLSGTYFFSCCGSTIKRAGGKDAFFKMDHDINLAFAQFAAKHHARHFALVSSDGANTTSKFFYLRVKGQVEEAISELNGLKSIHFLRPSFLMGDREEFRFGERLSILFLNTVFRPLRRFFANSDRSVATAMIHFAKQNQKAVMISDNRAIFEFEQG